MNITLELTGTGPMLMHNIGLANPDNPLVQEISTLTAKRKKTEEDRRAIGRLEWFGGLYVEAGRVVIPTANIKRCLVEAGKVTKQGAMISRALSFVEMNVPLAYDGPASPEELFKLPSFHDRSAVGVQGKRTMRVRPKFPAWAVVAPAMLLENVMDVDDLRRVAQLAGQAIGLGDNRVNGYGRFSAQIRA